ncbi:MAG: energy transducer TonB [Candidatus Sulfotelmatobacter sp.]|jgi:TonB family protein
MKTRILFATLALIVSSAGVYGQDSLARQHSEIVLHADLPRYPPLAIEARLSGAVHLHVLVKNGAVTKAASDSPTEPPILVGAATENVETWRFAPGATGTFDVTYTFELRKDEGSTLENPRIEMELPTFVKIVARPVRPACEDCGPGSFVSKPMKK